MSKKPVETYESNIVVFGSGGVGKSCLIVQLIQGVFVETYDPTLEDSYRKDLNLSDGTKVILNILDTAGQDEFITLRDQYIRHGEAFVIVFSVTSKASFNEVNNFLEEIRKIRDTKAKDATIPVIILANKCDLERVVSKEEADKLGAKFGVPVFETSAKTCTNVHESFNYIAQQLVELNRSKKKKKCKIQ